MAHSGATPILGLPYSTEDDDVEVPFDMQALAEAIEAKMFIIGEVRLLARTTAPAKWLLADGTVKNRADYTALFAAIGTSWNTGGETGTQFRLPALAGRALGAAGAGSGLTARTLGDLVGEERHTLTVLELASHVHGVPYNSSVAVNTGSQWTVPMSAGPGNTNSAGGDQPHNNIQPTAFLNAYIFAAA